MGYIEDFLNLSNSYYQGVFQKDYDFFYLKSKSDIKMKDQVYRIANSLGLKVEHSDFYDIQSLKSYRIKTIRQFEIVFLGYDYLIYKNIGKELINFDAIKYAENLNKFKTKYPDVSHIAESLYLRNINLIADFFLCDVEKLKQGKINLFNQSTKRLMFNINNR